MTNSSGIPEEFVGQVEEAMRIADKGGNWWRDAEGILRQVVSQCPSYTEAKFQLARLWTRGMRNKYNLGSSFTIEGDTHSIDNLFNSVDCLLKDVMKSNPKHPGPYYCYACWACFPLKESYSEMRRFYREAQSRDPEADAQYYIVHSDVAMAASKANDRDLAVDAFYWSNRTGEETGYTCPGFEPAYSYWKEACAKWQREAG